MNPIVKTSIENLNHELTFCMTIIDLFFHFLIFPNRSIKKLISITIYHILYNLKNLYIYMSNFFFLLFSHNFLIK